MGAEFHRGIVDGHAGRNNPPEQRLSSDGTTRLLKAYHAGLNVATEEAQESEDLHQSLDQEE